VSDGKNEDKMTPTCHHQNLIAEALTGTNNMEEHNFVIQLHQRVKRKHRVKRNKNAVSTNNDNATKDEVGVA
jgi:hypothetical protein